MKRMMRKAPPKNSTKERFPVIPQTLNSYNKRPKKTQQSSKPTQQPSKPTTKQQRVMYATVQGKSTYIRLLQKDNTCMYETVQEKAHVYVSKYNEAKEKAKKLRLKMNIGCQVVIRQETQYKREQSKEKKTPNPKKEYSIPSMVANSITRKISLWIGVNQNKRK
jgi:DNA-binding NarL/FixJ family response regulator